MANNKIRESNIADNAVTSDKLAAGTINQNRLAGSIENDKLTNSSITINGTEVSLGGSITVGETKPTITSISPDTITNSQTQIVITGTNFQTTPSVELINSTGGITFADTITRDSSTQLTVNVTLTTDGTYFIRVENPDGNAVRSGTAILTVSDAPTWSTSSGSLGDTVGFGESISFTVSASSDSSVTYSLQSGTLPSGASLNSSTGAITGTENSGGSSETTYNFTIRATDAESQIADRAFSITVGNTNYFGDGSDGDVST